MPFFGSFLGKQKRTKNILNKSFNQCLFFLRVQKEQNIKDKQQEFNDRQGLSVKIFGTPVDLSITFFATLEKLACSVC